MFIREVQVSDAKEYLKLCKELDAESEYLLYEKGERKTTIQEQEKAIQKVLETDNSTTIVAEIDGEMVGYLIARGGHALRIKHNVNIAIAIKEEYTGKGIGTALFEYIESWAKKRNITRLELGLMAENLPALILYKKKGFIIEGVRRNMFYINGRYIDEYIMAKLL